MSCENCGKEAGVRKYRRCSDGWVVPISVKTETKNGVCLWSMDAKSKYLPFYTCHPSLNHKEKEAFSTEKIVFCGSSEDEKWELIGVLNEN